MNDGRNEGCDMKRMPIGLALLGSWLLLTLPVALAQSPGAPRGPPDKPGKAIQSFHGRVDAVDVNARTFTVGGQVIYVADSTRISKHGKPIQLSEVAAGDMVHGTAEMTFD